MTSFTSLETGHDCLDIDLARKQAAAGSRRLALTRKEFELLMVLVQNAALPQQSVAFQMAVMTWRHGGLLLVMRFTTDTPGVGRQQLSVTVGVLRVQLEPQGRVWFGGQVMTGGVVSTMSSVPLAVPL